MANDKLKKMKKKIIMIQKFKDMKKKLELFIKTNEIELNKKEKDGFSNCLELISNKITQMETEVLNTGEVFFS